MARQGLEKARQAMMSDNYDIVVFDEIITAHYFQLISLDQLLDIIRSRPKDVEVVMTGRYAPAPLIDAADLVTEMAEIKHYHTKGIDARDGIEK